MLKLSNIFLLIGFGLLSSFAIAFQPSNPIINGWRNHEKSGSEKRRHQQILKSTEFPGQERTISIIEKCFDAWNRRDADEAISCFAENCKYDDSLFGGPPANKELLRKRFERDMLLLPSGTKVVVDALAQDPASNKIGARWHLELENGFSLPFGRGCSFYTTDPATGLIQTGFRVMESPVKPDDLVFNALAIPMKLADRLIGDRPIATPPTAEELESMSPIKRFYLYWNLRDLDTAVLEFAEDVEYEDTLYVQPFKGKEALKKHFARVANTLPSVCKIVVDDECMDPVNGNMSARWHLEVGNNNLIDGWSRGCSMYTTDPETGLITSGFDVTEPPLKTNDPPGFDLLVSSLKTVQPFMT